MELHRGNLLKFNFNIDEMEIMTHIILNLPEMYNILLKIRNVEKMMNINI